VQARDARRILIVEDEGIVARDIEETVRALGYSVTDVTTNAADALEKAARNQPDLVLMDIRLKGEMDGVDTAIALQGRFGTPVIYLTAHGDEITLNRAEVTSPRGYLVKPFRKDDLRLALERAFNGGA